MLISQVVTDLIKESEGCRLTAYRDPVGILTIGYGCTGSWVIPGMKITQEAADGILREEICKAATSVLRLTKVSLNDNQFAALIDFVYNLGGGRYQTSSIRSKLNRGEYHNAAEVLLKYVYAGGKILPGLVKRRRLEYELFMS